MKQLLFFLILLCANLLANDNYRKYDHNTLDRVQKTYYENHTGQTLSFVLEKKRQYSPLNHSRMGLWEVVQLLDKFVDESDPDTSLPQSIHAFQTAEALRCDGYPRWLILTGFIHDLGKMLYKFGEPQWAVVGDTFPVGCAPDPSIVYSEFFNGNPDHSETFFQEKLGIYKKGCGFSNLHMSFGHDEYLYYVMKPYLPEEALYIIRFHSFYPAHKEGAYKYFMNEYDKKMLPYLQLFSKYDLYSKVKALPDTESLLPYYQELVSEFLPEKLDW